MSLLTSTAHVWKTVGLAIVVTLSTSYAVAAAKGGDSSGGGSYCKEASGARCLGDEHFKSSVPRAASPLQPIGFTELPKDVIESVENIENFVTHLPLISADLVEFIKEKVKVESRYILVAKDREKSVPCDLYVPLLNGKVQAHYQYGCTQGEYTYLFASKWLGNSNTKNLAEDIELETFALLHERLWVIPGIDQATIADIVKGLRTALHIFERQKSGTPPKDLSPTDLATINNLYAAVFKVRAEANKSCRYNCPPTPNFKIVSGGAIVYGACLQRVSISESFINLGTSIYSPCSAQAPTYSILKSEIRDSGIEFGSSDSKIVSSHIVSSRIRTGEIESSAVENSNVQGILRSSRIQHSTIGPKVTLNDCAANESEIGTDIVAHESTVDASQSTFDHAFINVNTLAAFADFVTMRLSLPGRQYPVPASYLKVFKGSSGQRVQIDATTATSNAYDSKQF